MTWVIFISALSIGFVGSFHCIGMCGPLALALPVQHLSGIRKAIGILLYNSGRVCTYAVLGAIFGWLGSRFSMFGWQQGLSIGLGILLIISFIAAIMHKKLLIGTKLGKYWNKYIIAALTPLFKIRSMRMLFVIGLLNGLLPCGLVYMAIAGAIATDTTINGAIFMAAFGLGTLPSMMVVCFSQNLISLNVRNKIRSATPYIIGCMGLLLILRGMNLNIPYVSPKMEEQKVSCCHK